tara:strand:+ start:4050 stop:5222 length:1173 start_codon:yes stop_codon:yes gene_type:complete
MIKNVVIMGSTGSIGTSSLTVLKKNKNYKIHLLTTKSNVQKIFNQAIKFKVKNVIIEDKKEYFNFKEKFKLKNINLFLGIKNIQKILKSKKIDYVINSISGINGLEPTLNIIPNSKNILIANKETIICGWDIIKKKLTKYKTNFVPIDSEHFSIWKLIKNEPKSSIDRVILTASGGPFLTKSKRNLSNIDPKDALKHPNWKMGKKISIDSSTMMNKIFEYIEALKIFDLKKKEISILIHPSSFIHAIVFFKHDIIKFLAHETNMTIPITNALQINKIDRQNINKNLLKKFNEIKFLVPKKKIFPLLSIIDLIPDESSYFETILITINDNLVHKYLNGRINYKSIQMNILRLINKPFLSKYYKLKPKNIYDIKKMIAITNKYLEGNIKFYD